MVIEWLFWGRPMHVTLFTSCIFCLPTAEILVEWPWDPIHFDKLYCIFQHTFWLSFISIFAFEPRRLHHTKEHQNCIYWLEFLIKLTVKLKKCVSNVAKHIYWMGGMLQLCLVSFDQLKTASTISGDLRIDIGSSKWELIQISIFNPDPAVLAYGVLI